MENKRGDKDAQERTVEDFGPGMNSPAYLILLCVTRTAIGRTRAVTIGLLVIKNIAIKNYFIELLMKCSKEFSFSILPAVSASIRVQKNTFSVIKVSSPPAGQFVLQPAGA